MARLLAIELTMMVMIENIQGQVLVQDRQKKDWPGWTFPGGHVEENESIQLAAIREIQEETGLVIDPVLMGTAEWNHLARKERELAFLYTATTTDEPHNDSHLFWVDKQELQTQHLAGTLNNLLPIFFGELHHYYQED
ncbi:NUDIX domain-containing protein [Candidatus Enterococcus ferrettii]|uniref:8-oxo-dGTP diphosphatase n=1 Tax=Candidatus Enterococcus ferrettii TaxID=2815324 RepID=A0ABV0ERP4_9ENTE|nr:NUDIX domain-containing protein [Enterococcus sp. 665A]MBO1341913.1 NUDIX domain-containing protein [Enterococcus sp. 665A]